MSNPDYINNLPKELKFKWYNVPFIITELIWDYADTFRNIAIYRRPAGTKQLSNELRDLIKNYTKNKATELIKNEYDIQYNNLKNTMIYIQSRIDFHIQRKNKKYILDDKWLVGSAFGMLVYSKALFMYENDYKTKIEKIINQKIKNIVPQQIKCVSELSEKLCKSLLPDYTEILTELKYKILQSIKELNEIQN